jgi:hypothetical protein
MSLAGSGRVEPVAAAPEEEPDSLRYILVDAAEDARPRSLISVLGEPPPNVGEVLESVAFACRSRGEFPVAVMSELRPDLIAVSTVPIEFMPTRRYLPVRPDEYERHVRRRWSLMIAKWEFDNEIELGLGFEAFLAEQLSEPAADEPAAREPADRLRPRQRGVKRHARPHREDQLLDDTRGLERTVDEFEAGRSAAHLVAKIVR